MSDALKQLRAICEREQLPAEASDEIERLFGAVAAAGAAPDRYRDEGELGAGGMGEVRRVHDTRLDRTLAMKVIRGALVDDEAARARFGLEARLTAQLEHPGIIPVHEVGALPDGRLYYTMPVVAGDTLGEAIRDVHGAVAERRWQPTAGGRTFRGLAEALRRVCDAVAYAHAHGVVHLDLKPANVMLGPHGEVRVLDWGLAHVVEAVGRDAARAAGGDEPGGVRIAGTPSYMAPERLWSTPDESGAEVDVYALGAMLYTLLCGEAPYGEGSTLGVIQRLAAGPPVPVTEVAARRARPEPPADLAALIERAMARDPGGRPPDAGELGRELAAWIEGTRQLERAEGLLAGAARTAARADEARAQALQLRDGAGEQLERIPAHAPAEAKAAAWADEDRAAALERDVARWEAERARDLRAALALVPDLPDAHAGLAALHRAAHERAERDGDAPAVARHELALRHHDRDGHHRAYLDGEGRLTLVTDPPGAAATLLRLEAEQRRWTEVRVMALGETPVVELPLPMGRYAVRLRAPGRAEVVVPVHVRRLEHVDGVAPGAAESLPLPLPTADELGRDGCYVPAGWFVAGGDRGAPGSLPARRVWLDGFVIERYPVTRARFDTFLDALRADGDGELADALRPASDGPADAPVVDLSWEAAHAFARWQARRDRLPWRLPGELEWEKAARGVDGRAFPWGDHLDPSRCNMRDSHAGGARLAPVESFPDDVSPYGVRGMAGNARDYCLDRFLPDGPPVRGGRWQPMHPRTGEPLPDGALARLPFVDPDPFAGPVDWPRVGRGGAWCVNPVTMRAAYRAWFAPGYRSDDSVGFRLARSYPADPGSG